MAERDGREDNGGEDLERLAEELWRTYRGFVFHFFGRVGFSDDEAEDLTQRVFERVWRGLESLESRKAAKGWIQAIASNVWKNELRRRGADKRDASETSLDALVEQAGEIQPSAEVPGFSPSIPSPLKQTLLREEKTLVRQAMRRLAPRSREALELYVGGRSYQEVADEMGVTLQAVRSHIHQARQGLREELGRQR